MWDGGQWPASMLFHMRATGRERRAALMKKSNVGGGGLSLFLRWFGCLARIGLLFALGHA